MNRAESRLASLKPLLAEVHRRLELGFGFRLWDGSTVPDGWPRDALALSIADEGAIAGLMRAPNVGTLGNLWAAGRVDLQNGTLFDLIAKRPKGRTRELRKSLMTLKTATTLAPFLFVPRGGPWPLEHIGKDRESDGSEGENTRNIAYHYNVSNAFYALWLDKDMVYTCGYFHDWSDDLDTAQRQKLDMICRKLRLQPGRHDARHRQRLGLARLPRSKALRRARHRRDPLGRADRARPREGGAAWPGGQGDFRDNATMR